MTESQEQIPTLTALERTLAATCVELIGRVAPRHPGLQPLLDKVRAQVERAI